jgi:PAS domain S-box-containing protein
MSDELKQLLKSTAKDEAAYNELLIIFDQLSSKLEHTQKNLWLLEQAIKNDYDSILITDLEMADGGPKIVYVNEGFTKMTGYTREEVIGKTPRLLQGPKTDKGTLEHLKQSLLEGHSFFGQAVNYRKDGSEFINQWDIHPIYDEQGELCYWVSYQHDITTKKRAEAMYVEQDAHFDSMDELSKRTLIDFDPSGHVIYANKAFRALTGFAKEELSKMSIWDLINQRHAHSLKAQLASMDIPGELDTNRIKTVLIHKSGIPIQVEIKCHFHELTEGRLVRASIQNLSLQKRIVKTLSKRNSNFSSLVEKNSDFSYNLKTGSDGSVYCEWVSDSFTKVTGHDIEAILQTSAWLRLIFPDDISVFENHLRAVFTGKSRVAEYRMIHAEGGFIKVIDYGKPVIDPRTGDVLSVSGAIMDVTKDRQPSMS